MSDGFTKVCSRCGEVKPLEAFSKGTGYALGVRARCKVCEREYMMEYNASDAGKAAQKKYKKAVPDASKLWRKKHPEYGARIAKRIANLLTTSYIKVALTKQLSISYSAVPAGLIDIKREQLIMRRLARQLKKATHESSKDPD